eukprot:scaffold8804_cov80-Skeletonema_marinoi.AAC.4
MMPTRSVVRIVPPANGGGVTAPSAGNDPSPSSVSTAAADGIGSGEDNDAATAIISSASKSASTIADGKNEIDASDTTDKAESKVEGNTNQEGKACDVEAEVVSISTTAGGQSKTLRREDFNSALEYLEAKYVKSIVIEDDAAAAVAGSGSEQAAVKSRKNEVKISDSGDQMEDKSGKACQLENRANGQNAQ